MSTTRFIGCGEFGSGIKLAGRHARATPEHEPVPPAGAHVAMTTPIAG
jgi:hypothetical protein